MLKLSDDNKAEKPIKPDSFLKLDSGVGKWFENFSVEDCMMVGRGKKNFHFGINKKEIRVAWNADLIDGLKYKL
jgi:hypothetical protein